MQNIHKEEKITKELYYEDLNAYSLIDRVALTYTPATDSKESPSNGHLHLIPRATHNQPSKKNSGNRNTFPTLFSTFKIF